MNDYPTINIFQIDEIIASDVLWEYDFFCLWPDAQVRDRVLLPDANAMDALQHLNRRPGISADLRHTTDTLYSAAADRTKIPRDKVRFAAKIHSAI